MCDPVAGRAGERKMNYPNVRLAEALSAPNACEQYHEINSLQAVKGLSMYNV